MAKAKAKAKKAMKAKTTKIVAAAAYRQNLVCGTSTAWSVKKRKESSFAAMDVQTWSISLASKGRKPQLHRGIVLSAFRPCRVASSAAATWITSSEPPGWKSLND